MTTAVLAGRHRAMDDRARLYRRGRGRHVNRDDDRLGAVICSAVFAAITIVVSMIIVAVTP